MCRVSFHCCWKCVRKHGVRGLYQKIGVWQCMVRQVYKRIIIDRVKVITDELFEDYYVVKGVKTKYLQ